MNGAHDLGGKHGFGTIDSSQQENFKHTWEEKVFSLTLACGMLGRWNLDQSRFARERAEPAEYLAGSYYEHWLHGLETLLVENGLVSDEELQSGIVDSRSVVVEAASPERIDEVLSSGGPTLMEEVAPARFSIGDKVVVNADNQQQHTRAPAYVKGKVGEVVSHHGSHIYADEHALSGNKSAAHLYGVRFEPQSLWGESAAERCPVYVDLFEPYLQSLQQHIAALELLVRPVEAGDHHG